MSNKKDTGGPAFPSEQHETLDGTWNQTFGSGMTLRDWFAGQALAGMHLPSDYKTGPCNEAAVKRCFAISDLMLKARGES